jgi:hypothetical protein
VLDHEFIYTKPPTTDVRRIFEGEMCPGITFNTSDDWLELYRTAGLTDLHSTTGPFEMMTPAGMWRDEGPGGLLRMMIRASSRLSYMRKMAWMMPRILRVRSYLGYIVLVGTKPTRDS